MNERYEKKGRQKKYCEKKIGDERIVRVHDILKTEYTYELHLGSCRHAFAHFQARQIIIIIRDTYFSDFTYIFSLFHGILPYPIHK